MMHRIPRSERTVMGRVGSQHKTRQQMVAEFAKLSSDCGNVTFMSKNSRHSADAPVKFVPSLEEPSC